MVASRARLQLTFHSQRLYSAVFHLKVLKWNPIEPGQGPCVVASSYLFWASSSRTSVSLVKDTLLSEKSLQNTSVAQSALARPAEKPS